MTCDVGTSQYMYVSACSPALHLHIIMAFLSQRTISSSRVWPRRHRAVRRNDFKSHHYLWTFFRCLIRSEVETHARWCFHVFSITVMCCYLYSYNSQLTTLTVSFEIITFEQALCRITMAFTRGRGRGPAPFRI